MWQVSVPPAVRPENVWERGHGDPRFRLHPWLACDRTAVMRKVRSCGIECWTLQFLWPAGRRWACNSNKMSNADLFLPRGSPRRLGSFQLIVDSAGTPSGFFWKIEQNNHLKWNCRDVRIYYPMFSWEKGERFFPETVFVMLKDLMKHLRWKVL